MFRRALLLATALCTIAAPAHAQFVVIDPANLVQTTLIAYRVQQHYTELRAQYLTVLRMAQRLGSLDRFRTPPIALTSHDPSRWDFGRPWIQALNSGDPTGSAYLSTALPLLRPTTTPPTLSAAARQMLQRQYATDRDHRLGCDDGRPPGRSGTRLPRPASERRASLFRTMF